MPAGIPTVVLGAELFERGASVHGPAAWDSRFGPNFFPNVLIVLSVWRARKITSRSVLLFALLVIARVQIVVDMTSLAPLISL